MTGGWNYATVWELVADDRPDALAQINGDRHWTWREFDRRADGVAHHLLARGARHQDKVAQYLFNGPEYLETVFACFKASLVPVNTNYRYADDELVYIWDNSDAVAVVFHATFVPTIERVRARCPKVATWLWVDDASHPCPEWAEPYETAAAHPPAARVSAPEGRSGDDLYFLYTGGTTGMPKGVMWRQDDLVVLLEAGSKQPLGAEVDPELVGRRLVAGLVGCPAAPLMHGTGAFNSFSVLACGGAIVTLQGRSFDASELLEAIERNRIKSISIVGDAFAKPILRALDTQPGRHDISSLRVITSSGVMWAAETKQGLLRHNRRLIMIDSLGSSEAIGMASSVSTSDAAEATATFRLSESTRVLTEDGRQVMPGSGERGRVALKGRVPLGYYKDEAKSAATFVTFDGVRYSIPGDWATVEADGTISLLGRGSVCINTGGEKVYPEEVEEALKTHPSVHDAVVVGVPDERFGQAIVAVVEADHGAPVVESELIAHVKGRLAHYKAPKRVLTVATIGRAANGKVDYRRHTDDARRELGV
jgi:acyl-CoA synthetase (AMP-forming)/AMP-acid ligase II